MAEAMRRLLDRGHGAASLWVFRANAAARRFLERLGGVVLVEQPFEMEGTTLLETSYAWPSLAASLTATNSTASATIGVGSRQ